MSPTAEVAARRMGASARTFRRAQASAVERLGAASLLHAVALAAARGLIDIRHLEARTLPDWPASPREGETAVKWATYSRLRDEGVSQAKAAEAAGLSLGTASRFDKARKSG